MVWFDEDGGLVETIMVCNRCDDDRLLRLLMAHRGPDSRDPEQASQTCRAIDLDGNMAWAKASAEQWLRHYYVVSFG